MKKNNYKGLEQTKKVLDGRNLPYTIENKYIGEEDEVIQVLSPIGEGFMCMVSICDRFDDDESHQTSKNDVQNDESLVFVFYHNIPEGFKVSVGYKRKLKTLIKSKTDGFVYIDCHNGHLGVVMLIEEMIVNFEAALDKGISIMRDPEVLQCLSQLTENLKPIQQ